MRILVILGLVAAIRSAAAEVTLERTFWDRVADPHGPAARDVFNQAKEAHGSADRVASQDKGRELLGRALNGYRRVIKLAVGDLRSRACVGAAKVLFELEKPKQSLRYLRLADRYHLTPNHSIPFQAGITYSKLGQLRQALEAYERTLKVMEAENASGQSSRELRAVVHGNMGETLMAMGRLREAIQAYRLGLSLTPYYPLARWGLAVALDRNGQTDEALGAIAPLVRRDPSMRSLTAPGVFFVPAGDIHYYRALGYRALGRHKAALVALGRFAQMAPRGPFASRATAIIRRLRHSSRQPSATSTSARVRLGPIPGTTRPRGLVIEDMRRVRRYIVNRISPSLARCYREYAQRDKSGKRGGRIRISVRVAPPKKPAAHLVNDEVGSRMLRTCILQRLRRGSYPQPRARKALTLPLAIQFTP